MRISDWSSDVCSSDLGAQALEMTKWFDTNYHFMVPEFTHGQAFALASTKPVDEYREAKALGYRTRPVFLGPVPYLKPGKSKDPTLDPLSPLAGLLPVYLEVLRRPADGALGSAHVWTPVTNAQLVCRLPLEKNNQ